MRRMQLYIDESLHDALSAKAARLGVSRSSVVRDAVRLSLAEALDHRPDSIDSLIGHLDVQPDGDIDSVIYGSAE